MDVDLYRSAWHAQQQAPSIDPDNMLRQVRVRHRNGRLWLLSITGMLTTAWLGLAGYFFSITQHRAPPSASLYLAIIYIAATCVLIFITFRQMTRERSFGDSLAACTARLLAQTRHWVLLLKIALWIQIPSFFLLAAASAWSLSTSPNDPSPRTVGFVAVSMVWMAGWISLFYFLLRDKYLPRKRNLEDMQRQISAL